MPPGSPLLNDCGPQPEPGLHCTWAVMGQHLPFSCAGPQVKRSHAPGTVLMSLRGHVGPGLDLDNRVWDFESMLEWGETFGGVTYLTGVRVEPVGATGWTVVDRP